MAKSPKGKKGKKSTPTKATEDKVKPVKVVEEKEEDENIEDCKEKKDVEKENTEIKSTGSDEKSDSVYENSTNKEEESKDENDQDKNETIENDICVTNDNDKTDETEDSKLDSEKNENSSVLTEDEPMEVLDNDDLSSNSNDKFSEKSKVVKANENSVEVCDSTTSSESTHKQTHDSNSSYNELNDDSIILCGSDKKDESAEVLSSDIDKSFESDEGEFESSGIAHITSHFLEKTVEDGDDWTLESRLESFMEWCKMKGLTLSPKVEVTTEGVCHRYGMIATEDIKKGDLLFNVPRAVTLHPDNSRIVAEIVDYEDWLDSIGQSLDDSSGWATLLIALMLEFNDENSYWAPYLRLVPQPEEFGHPLFWTANEHKEELKGTTLLYDVQRDVYNIESEYKQFILPFIYRYKDICGRTDRYNLMLYKRLVAFVMAYSFTEDFDSQPGMIPMADILNHSVNNNAYLIFGEDDMKMVALKKIKKGEEIFNTFGKLGNAELLQMYGYADEEPNVFDSLPILVNNFFEAIEKQDEGKAPDRVSESMFQAKVSLLNKTEIALVDDFFLFDRNGMRKGPDIIQMLKILFMSDDEFEALLMSRAGNRPDSFYQKLLRKLKLARKTDTSSGIAIIDITDEELDIEIPPKRKIVDSQEIDDSEPPNKQGRIGSDMQMTYMSLAHPAHNLPLNMLHSQYSAFDSGKSNSNGGNSKSSAILIDDSDEDSDEDEPKQKGKVNENSDAEEATEEEKKDVDSEVDGSPKGSEEKSEGKKAEGEDIEGTGESKSDETETSEKETEEKDTSREKEIAAKDAPKEDTKEPVSTEKMETAVSAVNESKDDESKDDEASKKDSSEDKAEESREKTGDAVEGDVAKKDEKETSTKMRKVNGDVSDVVSIGDDNEEELNEDEVDDDQDDIEIVSEDIRCKMTYTNLKKELKPEWRDFLISVLTDHINQLKQDEEMTVQEARAKMSERQFYAYQIRQGQRFIAKTFISSLGT